MKIRNWLMLHFIGRRFKIYVGGICGPAESLWKIHRPSDCKWRLWQYIQASDRSFRCLSHRASVGAGQLDLLIKFWIQCSTSKDSRVKGNFSANKRKIFYYCPHHVRKLRDYEKWYSESDFVCRAARKTQSTCNQSTKNATNISRREAIDALLTRRCRVKSAIKNLIIIVYHN